MAALLSGQAALLLLLQALGFVLVWWMAPMPRAGEGFLSYWKRGGLWMMAGAALASISLWGHSEARFALLLMAATMMAASVLRFRAFQGDPIR